MVKVGLPGGERFPYFQPATMNDPTFTYDVFLSHSSKDKPVVREIAKRLREAGLRLWFDEWELPVASVYDRRGENRRSRSAATVAKIEEGLERSRVLPLAHRMGEGGRRAGEGCMSAQAFGSDWAQLEAGTFGSGNLPFRDPLNRDSDHHWTDLSSKTWAPRVERLLMV